MDALVVIITWRPGNFKDKLALPELLYENILPTILRIVQSKKKRKINDFERMLHLNKITQVNICQYKEFTRKTTILKKLIIYKRSMGILSR